jgi:hypothetical protein
VPAFASASCLYRINPDLSIAINLNGYADSAMRKVRCDAVANSPVGAAHSAVGGRGQIASKPLIYTTVPTPKGRFSGAGMDYSAVDRGNPDDAVLAQPLDLVSPEAAVPGTARDDKAMTSQEARAARRSQSAQRTGAGVCTIRSGPITL